MTTEKDNTLTQYICMLPWLQTKAHIATILPYLTGRTLMGSVGSPFIVPWQTLCASTSDNSSILPPSAVPTAAQRNVRNHVQNRKKYEQMKLLTTVENSW
jgi:hypothetical protein